MRISDWSSDVCSSDLNETFENLVFFGHDPTPSNHSAASSRFRFPESCQQHFPVSGNCRRAEIRHAAVSGVAGMVWVQVLLLAALPLRATVGKRWKILYLRISIYKHARQIKVDYGKTVA